MLYSLSTNVYNRSTEKTRNHSVNSSSHSLNGDIAIQWEWSNFDPSQNPNPWTDYDKTLHNWLRPRDEHVTQNLCQSAVRERLAKCVKYKASLFLLFFIFSRARLLKSSVDGLWHTIAQNTRCDVRKCLFWVHTMADNILGFKFPKKPSKIAFYKHVLASANGLETNDVIEDWRHWLRNFLAVVAERRILASGESLIKHYIRHGNSVLASVYSICRQSVVQGVA